MLVLLIYKAIVIIATEEVISAKVLSKNVYPDRVSQNSFAGKALPCGITPPSTKKLLLCQQQLPLYQ
jgi:hypothetical protein